MWARSVGLKKHRMPIIGVVVLCLFSVIASAHHGGTHRAMGLTVPAVSSGDYTVTWSDNLTGSYRLYESFNGGEYTQVPGGTPISFTKPAGTYTYYVHRYYNYCDYGCYIRNEYSYTKSTTVLGPPGTISFSDLSHAGSQGDNNGAFTVRWGASSGATAYRLEQRFNGGSWSTIHNASGTSRSRSNLVNVIPAQAHCCPG